MNCKQAFWFLLGVLGFLVLMAVLWLPPAHAGSATGTKLLVIYYLGENGVPRGVTVRSNLSPEICEAQRAAAEAGPLPTNSSVIKIVAICQDPFQQLPPAPKESGLLRHAAATLFAPTPQVLGPADYCDTWAYAALYGVGKYLRAPEAMRAKILIFRRRADDGQAAPETVVIDGEELPMMVIVTSGLNEDGTPWEADEAYAAWAEEAVRGGWNWASTNPIPERAQVARTMLREHCLKSLQL